MQGATGKTVKKKRKVDTKSDEAYAVMTQLSSNVKKRDDFDVYGEYVANTLRNLKCKSVLTYAKYEINNVLYRAEISDVPQNAPVPSSSRLTSPIASPVTPIQTDTDTQSYTGPEDNTQDRSEFTQLLLTL